MPQQISAVEVDRKMRDDYRRRLKDYGIASETIDPVLAVIFRTFAQQIETLYDNTDRIRLSLLDEFLNSLAFAPRTARAAQTIVRLFVPPGKGPFVVPAGSELNATAPSGERLTFRIDSGVHVSAATVAFALSYQNRQVRLIPGIDLPEALRELRPSIDPIPCDLGPTPALFLAFEDLPPQHLSGHSLYFDLGPDSHRIQQALWSEPWCLVGAEGELSAKGVLRPRRGNAGVQLLQPLIPAAPENESEAAESATLPDGFYAGRVFVFPKIHTPQAFRCEVPRGLEAALHQAFGAHYKTALSSKRAWVRVSMPPQVPNLDTAFSSILLHSVSASNVEARNQTVRFETHGTSIPVSREAGTSRFLVAPLSILGEDGASYLPDLEPAVDTGAGRYSVLNGRIELQPAKDLYGNAQKYANLRVWTTSGPLANSVAPGQVNGFTGTADFASLRVINPVSAAGGTDGESFANAHDRFASALLSRDRIVTRADLERVVFAFDRRIISVNNEQLLERTNHGLLPIERVTVEADRSRFVDLDAELALLEEDLQAHLSTRVISGVRVHVEVVAI